MEILHAAEPVKSGTNSKVWMKEERIMIGRYQLYDGVGILWRHNVCLSETARFPGFLSGVFFLDNLKGGCLYEEFPYQFQIEGRIRK